MSQVMIRVPSEVLMHAQHIGCSFYEAEDGSIFVLKNPSLRDLVEQTAKILKCGYVLAGGIQVGKHRNAATFLLAEGKESPTT